MRRRRSSLRSKHGESGDTATATGSKPPHTSPPSPTHRSPPPARRIRGEKRRDRARVRKWRRKPLPPSKRGDGFPRTTQRAAGPTGQNGGSGGGARAERTAAPPQPERRLRTQSGRTRERRALPRPPPPARPWPRRLCFTRPRARFPTPAPSPPPFHPPPNPPTRAPHPPTTRTDTTNAPATPAARAGWWCPSLRHRPHASGPPRQGGARVAGARSPVAGAATRRGSRRAGGARNAPASAAAGGPALISVCARAAAESQRGRRGAQRGGWGGGGTQEVARKRGGGGGGRGWTAPPPHERHGLAAGEAPWGELLAWPFGANRECCAAPTARQQQRDGHCQTAAALGPQASAAPPPVFFLNMGGGASSVEPEGDASAESPLSTTHPSVVSGWRALGSATGCCAGAPIATSQWETGVAHEWCLGALERGCWSSWGRLGLHWRRPIRMLICNAHAQGVCVGCHARGNNASRGVGTTPREGWDDKAHTACVGHRDHCEPSSQPVRAGDRHLTPSPTCEKQEFREPT